MSVKLGFRFKNHKDWTGGVYYLSNLVNAFNALDDKLKPQITIFCNTDEEQTAKAIIHYNKLNFFLLDKKLSLYKRVVNKLSNLLLKKELFSVFPQKELVDLIFPNAEKYYFKDFKRLNWIPDFQEDHLTYLFDEKELKDRKRVQTNYIKDGVGIVLSSQYCYDDYKRLFSDSKTPAFILRFAVTHPDYRVLNINKLKEKYNLNEKWFFSPNQFWSHKNHKVVIEAVFKLKEKYPKIQVLFSGKEHDYRDPDYTNRLKEKVNEAGLQNNVLFMGFMDRKEQLQLMNHSLAIIQPSLFEGWSTVVEDAKAMSQIVLASDIEVHKEQFLEWKGSGITFVKDDPSDLAAKMEDVIEGKVERKSVDYMQNVRNYALEFLKMAEKIKAIDN